MSNNKGPKVPEKSKEQACQLDIVVRDNKVVLEFKRSVNWLALTPDQALAMGQALMQCATLAHNKKLIVVPGKGG